MIFLFAVRLPPGPLVQDLQAQGARCHQDEALPHRQGGPGDCPQKCGQVGQEIKALQIG